MTTPALRPRSAWLGRAAVTAATGAVIAAVAMLAGGRWAALVGVVAVVAWVGVVIFLPRAAHGAFAGGDHRRAARRYRVLAAVTLDPVRRAGTRISLAACALAAGDWARGASLLEALDRDALDEPGQAAWLNNRAYAELRAEGDARRALAWADQALTLRPDVPGFVHTRGLALLAAGRVDDAIRTFDGLWSTGEVEPRLEAERCWDLARAWDAKGQGDYAADYRGRISQICPDSPWARRAGPTPSSVALPDL